MNIITPQELEWQLEEAVKFEREAISQVWKAKCALMEAEQYRQTRTFIVETMLVAGLVVAEQERKV